MKGLVEKLGPFLLSDSLRYQTLSISSALPEFIPVVKRFQIVLRQGRSNHYDVDSSILCFDFNFFCALLAVIATLFFIAAFIFPLNQTRASWKSHLKNSPTKSMHLLQIRSALAASRTMALSLCKNRLVTICKRLAIRTCCSYATATGMCTRNSSPSRPSCFQRRNWRQHP